MKQLFVFPFFFFLLSTTQVAAQKATSPQASKERFFIDVHHLVPGKVSFDDVAAAHAKDLATQEKYGVSFLRYWVDEKTGNVYCLSSARDSSAVVQTHREAHGLLPNEIHGVKEGIEALPEDGKTYFLDIHRLGKVKASDVAKAHEKDLAVQGKYGVNFINYWVDEKKGMVYCLSQASDAAQVIQTHKEAHGLIPDSVELVKQGK